MADTGKNRAETLAASLEQLTAGWTPVRGSWRWSCCLGH
jgi:hypothetical protein